MIWELRPWTVNSIIGQVRSRSPHPLSALNAQSNAVSARPPGHPVIRETQGRNHLAPLGRSVKGPVQFSQDRDAEVRTPHYGNAAKTLAAADPTAYSAPHQRWLFETFTPHDGHARLMLWSRMAAEPEDLSPEPTIAELIAARPLLRLHPMDGLVMEDVPLHLIADGVGTPTWVYSANTLRGRYRALDRALRDAGLDAQTHYAVKANDHLAILSLFGREGAGADVVSEGELLRARAAGIPANRIVYSASAKRSVNSASL